MLSPRSSLAFVCVRVCVLWKTIPHFKFHTDFSNFRLYRMLPLSKFDKDSPQPRAFVQFVFTKITIYIRSL